MAYRVSKKKKKKRNVAVGVWVGGGWVDRKQCWRHSSVISVSTMHNLYVKIQHCMNRHGSTTSILHTGGEGRRLTRSSRTDELRESLSHRNGQGPVRWLSTKAFAVGV